MAKDEAIATEALPEEFDIDLIDDNVEDDTKKEPENIIRFNCSSYGADYTVDSLIKRMKTGAFFVPPFQRAYVWSQNQASRFIESMLLGLPVPGIFLYKEPETNKHMVIDGQQRLRTLQYFSDGVFAERKFRLTNISEQWAGKTWEDLDEADRLKLDDSIVHATIFQQDEPKTGDQSIYYVFERINTGGIRLSSQEIRVCLNYGPFAALLKNLNAFEGWRKIFGPPSKRLKDQELILRFFALHFSDKYQRPMNIFLNNFMEQNRRLQTRNGEEFSKVFCNTIDAVEKAIGVKAFRPVSTINAAVFDSVMVAIARRLSLGSIPSLDSLKVQYDALLENKEFQETIARSTADEERVEKRLRLAHLFISKVK
jgi:uncharacterized protein DUF262